MSATKKTITRLRIMAFALREAAKVKSLTRWFSMKRYGYAKGDEVNDEKVSCGTPACALGHFAARRDLQSFLRLDKKTGELTYVRKELPSRRARIMRWLGADYADRRVERYFGLTSSEAVRIFSPQGCNHAKTPLAAADYIEQFCKQKEKELGLV